MCTNYTTSIFYLILSVQQNSKRFTIISFNKSYIQFFVFEDIGHYGNHFSNNIITL